MIAAERCHGIEVREDTSLRLPGADFAISDHFLPHMVRQHGAPLIERKREAAHSHVLVLPQYRNGDGRQQRQGEAAMVQINTDGAVHTGFTETNRLIYGSEVQYMPYPDGPELHMLKRAVYIIEHNIYRKNVACSRYFETLNKDKPLSFDDVWQDKDVWINLDPRQPANFDGFNSNAHPKDITIAARAFRRNVWFVTSVIVHELAHVAGAPPESKSDAAERSLLHCGLRAFYHLDDRRRAMSESPPPAVNSESAVG